MSIPILNVAIDDMLNFIQQRNRYGIPFHTPNFDAFMARATTFRNANCATAQCGPSRCSTMTQMTPAETGASVIEQTNNLRPRATNSIQSYLRRAGYNVVMRGKVWDGRTQPSDLNRLAVDTNAGGQGSSNMSNVTTDHGGYLSTVTLGPDSDYGDNPIVDWWEAYIAAYNDDRPLAAFAGLFAPHDPYPAPQWCYDLFPLDQIVIPDDYSAIDHAPLPDALWNYEATRTAAPGQTLDWRQNDEYLRRTIRGYLACTAFADHNFGRIVAAWEAKFGNTGLVFWWSDHGFLLGEFDTWFKLVSVNQCSTIPLAFRHPGQTEGRMIEKPVSFLDIMPTVLDYAEVRQPPRRVGKSLRPLIEGTGDTGEHWAITTVFGTLSGMIEDGGTIYRVNEYLTGEVSVFDCATDWYCINSIAAVDPALTARLLAKLRAMAVQGGFGYPGGARGAARRSAVLASVAATGDEALKLGGGGDQLFMAGNLPDGSTTGGGVDMLWFLPDHRGDIYVPDGIKIVNRASRAFWAGRGTTNGIANIFANTLDGHIDAGRGALGIIRAQGGNDTIIGGTEVYGGAGDDKITTYWLRDLIYGGSGNDTIDGGEGDDTIYGGTGNDSIIGGTGNDLIYGGPGDDRLSGGDGNDTLYSGPGQSTIWGGAGDDVIHADGGSNVLYGQTGADTFHFYPTELVQTVMDFEAADTLNFSRLAHLGALRLTQSGTEVRATVAAEVIVLRNTTVAAVTPRITGISIAT